MRIEFDSEHHAYRLNGQSVPSVTQVLAPLDLLGGIPYETLEHAHIRGQHVHEAMALLVRGKLDWASLDLALVPYIEGGRRFLDESGITPIASECRVGCTRLRCAGTLDLLGHWRKSEALIDFKATATLPPSVGPQVAAYDRLYAATHGGKARRRYCVLLRPGDYRIYPLTDPSDWSIFQSCLNLAHWRAKHAA